MLQTGAYFCVYVIYEAGSFMFLVYGEQGTLMVFFNIIIH